MCVCWFSAFLALVTPAATAASQPDRPTGGPLFVAVEAEAVLADLERGPDASVLRQRLVRVEEEILESARRPLAGAPRWPAYA